MDLRANRGQLSYLPATARSARLRLPVSFGGHLTPVTGLGGGEAGHVLGSSYGRWDLTAAPEGWANLTERDRAQPMAKLADVVPGLAEDWSAAPLTGWAGLRATTADHLPLVAAQGGPGGAPGCGSLPDVAKNFPVRQLITNTGWGRGLDVRPNPGIGFPCYANWLPSTRAVPERPSVRNCLPGPAIGPVPYPGAPPYGAAMYGPGGIPLWPGLPPGPPVPGPAQPHMNGQTPP